MGIYRISVNHKLHPASNVQLHVWVVTSVFRFLQQHRFSYNEPMPVESVTQSLCDLALRFGEDDEESGGGGMVRSFP